MDKKEQNMIVLNPSSAQLANINEQYNCMLLRRDIIVKVIQTVMKENIHYGKIPGCPLPSLYKTGAEVLLSTFNLRMGEPKVEKICDGNEEITYRISVPILNNMGEPIAYGLGMASSYEKKWRWRKITKMEEDEFQNAPSDKKREIIKEGPKGKYIIKQLRQEPKDIEETLLQMAHKRAVVAGVRWATGCSEFFTQDIEDIGPQAVSVDFDISPKPGLPMATKSFLEEEPAKEKAGKKSKSSEKIKCPNCNTLNNEGSTICYYCEADLGKVE